MVQKQIKGIISAVTLFLIGITIIYVGLFKGHDIAINVSRPAGATVWTTPPELISGYTFFLGIIGVSLIILSIMFSTVLFMYWLNKSK
ncbi:hypothetical protein JMF89_00130 [Clostridiaceae bacterium UIB06]|uniref:Uncharacterized protein n=1 Tax=Clostridium thailandense TaxID=2794346 RepID=A0A949X2Z3_9CLOT|nr:hypothetical protein [Clostridium thailandense]MBV7271833.1 hypothetical protein [Clostridium thailandense]MCH5135629.1 hypothetical protein [Clostridiaceae bacterium UIB06]